MHAVQAAGGRVATRSRRPARGGGVGGREAGGGRVGERGIHARAAARCGLPVRPLRMASPWEDTRASRPAAARLRRGGHMQAGDRVVDRRVLGVGCTRDKLLAHRGEPRGLRRGILAVHRVKRPVWHRRARRRGRVDGAVVDLGHPDLLVVILRHQPHHVLVRALLRHFAHLRDVGKAHAKLAQLVWLAHRLHRGCEGHARGRRISRWAEWHTRRELSTTHR